MTKKSDLPEPRPNVLFKNYDLYPDKNSHPDVSFYQELYKFKSVQEYLKDKKRKERNKKRNKRRKKMLKLTTASYDNNFLDFNADNYNYIDTDVQNSSVENSNVVGGLLDHVTQKPDADDNSIGSNLNYGVQSDFRSNQSDKSYKEIYDILSSAFKDIMNVLNNRVSPRPSEPPIYGMNDGISPNSDKDQIYNASGFAPEHGYAVTDSGNTAYNGAPFPTQ